MWLGYPDCCLVGALQGTRQNQAGTFCGKAPTQRLSLLNPFLGQRNIRDALAASFTIPLCLSVTDEIHGEWTLCWHR
jgi:hypothetical protein